MPVPTYDLFIEPMLWLLAEHPDGVFARDAHQMAAAALNLTNADKMEFLPSGVQHVYKNRAGWAHDRLKRAGLSSSPRRGYWKLTAEGMDFVRRTSRPLTTEQVEEIARGHEDVRLTPLIEGDDEPVPSVHLSVVPASATTSPDDRLEQALAEIRQAVTAELLEQIGQSSPEFFETLVLDLLHAMGYGTSRTDLQRVGRSGDGGIDGIISLDRLGLEKVYVQAKRWQNSVGRPEIQGFYGALAGQRARKGVFITTSSFTAQAVEFTRSIEQIVLVDGRRLADFLIEHGVGVTHRLAKIPKLDTDYFEE